MALLLEANPRLTPSEAKIALQLTSSRVAGAGLIEAGAGSLNIAAAMELAEGGADHATVNVAGEPSTPTGIFYLIHDGQPGVAVAVHPALLPDWTGLTPSPVELRIDGALKTSEVLNQSIVWGSCIVWGSNIVSGNNIV